MYVDYNFDTNTTKNDATITQMNDKNAPLLFLNKPYYITNTDYTSDNHAHDDYLYRRWNNNKTNLKANTSTN